MKTDDIMKHIKHTHNTSLSLKVLVLKLVKNVTSTKYSRELKSYREALEFQLRICKKYYSGCRL